MFLAVGIASLFVDAEPWIVALSLILAAALLSGLFGVPFVFVRFRRRRAMLANLQLGFGEGGLHSVWIVGETDMRWSGIESVRRDDRLLSLKLTAGSTMLVPVRAFDADQLDRFGRLALAHGLTLDGHRVQPPAR